jgi:hypothetical protein
LVVVPGWGIADGKTAVTFAVIREVFPACLTCLTFHGGDFLLKQSEDGAVFPGGHLREVQMNGWRKIFVNINYLLIDSVDMLG